MRTIPRSTGVLIIAVIGVALALMQESRVGPHSRSFANLMNAFVVADAYHDWANNVRLNLPLVIPPLTCSIVRSAVVAVEMAPVGRRLNLARIAARILPASRRAAGTDFYVSRIWLE